MVRRVPILASVGQALARAGLLFERRCNSQDPGRRDQDCAKTWHHLALVRKGRQVVVYLDGNPKPEISGEAGWMRATQPTIISSRRPRRWRCQLRGQDRRSRVSLIERSSAEEIRRTLSGKPNAAPESRVRVELREAINRSTIQGDLDKRTEQMYKDMSSMRGSRPFSARWRVYHFFD